MTESATQDPSNTGQFIIQRVYVKNLSYETNNVPAVFQQEWQPELSLDLNTQHSQLEPQIFEVVLTVTVTVKNKQSTAFLVEVQQAGIFTIQGPSDEQLAAVLATFCPSILFPYAREAITSEVARGSFPQLVLAPVNFDALYAQHQQKLLDTHQASDA